MSLALILQDELKSAAEASVTLYGEYSLANPLFVLLGPVALLALLWGRTRAGRTAGRVSALPGVRLPRSFRQQTTWISTVLQALAIVACSVALTRPLRGSVEEAVVSEGVDIAVVIDRSSSMQLPDLDENQARTRFDVVREVVEDFAVRRMTDREGNADNVALISFAFYPDVICPFTLDVNAFTNFLRATDVVEGGSPEDGTAIGIALAKAVSVISKTDARSKIVVLLTDGENGINDITPIEAAELAAAEGVRVYTIHAARYVYKRNFRGLYASDEEPDTSELQAIAEKTGGRFYRARDREGLEAIYAEIEELERTPREERRYSETYDLYPIFLQAGIGLYVLAWILGATWSRRLP